MDSKYAMKRCKITFLGLAALAIVAGSALSAPRLTIPESSFDFGFVPQHSSVSHSFWLYSTGDDELKILKVVPG